MLSGIDFILGLSARWSHKIWYGKRNCTSRDAGVPLLSSSLETNTTSPHVSLTSCISGQLWVTYPYLNHPLVKEIEWPSISIEGTIPQNLRWRYPCPDYLRGLAGPQQGDSCLESHGKLNLSSGCYFKDFLVHLSLGQIQLSPDRQELRSLGGTPVCRQDSLMAQQLRAKKEYPRSHIACFEEALEVTQSHSYCHLQTTQV